MSQDQASQAKSQRARTATRVLVALTLLVTVAFAVAVFAVVMLWDAGGGRVSEGSTLRVTVPAMLGDAPMSGGLFMEPDDAPPTATDMAAVIRAAAADDRIESLYVTMENPLVGWALARELRNALVAFRESGKPCVAYSEIWTMKDYYIASACDEVLAPPAGVTFIAGMQGTVTFYKDGLEKLGIQPQVVHVGEYKSAIEPFTRMEPSDAAKESYNALYDSLWETVTAEIAASRNLTPERVREILDTPSLVPERAVEAGLLTGVAYPDAVHEHVTDYGAEGWHEKLAEPVVEREDREDRDDERFTTFKEYRTALRDAAPVAGDAVAVIFAEGFIASGDDEGGLFGGGGMLLDRPFRSWMSEARTDEDVKAVVVRVNSPGGSALAADMMWREVARTRAAGKPVVVSMGDYAASGGYMMSCNADWIVAQPTTLTGSIGVFMLSFQAEETYKKLGLADYSYKGGSIPR